MSQQESLSWQRHRRAAENSRKLIARNCTAVFSAKDGAFLTCIFPNLDPDAHPASCYLMGHPELIIDNHLKAYAIIEKMEDERQAQLENSGGQ